MKKKQPAAKGSAKLKLERKTVRTLDDGRLREAAGAYYIIASRGCNKGGDATTKCER